MATIELDLGEPERRREGFSDRSEALARQVLSAGRWERLAGNSILVQSLNNASSYTVTLIESSDGEEVLGITCTCPNGRLGGIQARCYHAAVLNLINDPDSL